MYKLRIPDHVVSLIRNLHPEIKRKITDSLQTIAADLNAGKALKDELSLLRSFQVGRFRIIYRRAVRNEIQVVAIGPRKWIYEETYRRIRKESKGQQ
jgi:mRNA-degrading endonuclease RelE of RelBE toxin-antitoxin system